jgi:hypothetical protein
VALSTQPPGGWVNVPAQAEIVLAESVRSVTLPERCVTTDPLGQSIVRVRGQSGDRPRVVELGVVRDDRIQIRAGLDEGQTVVCPSAPPQRSAASSPRAAAGAQPTAEPVQRER